MGNRLKTGLVGAGVFASYHAGKTAASSHTEFMGVLDSYSDRANALAGKHGVPIFEKLEALIEVCDALIIATPAECHYDHAEAGLSGGCHVLVEKPLCLHSVEADHLVALAQERGLVLQVGHQERLVLAELGLKEIAERPARLEILRAGPPPKDGRAMDVSVIWDLMIHDLDLVHALLGEDTAHLTCTGQRKLGPQFDQATAAFQIKETELLLEASRIAPKQERVMKLVYASGEIVIDFTARTVINTSAHSVKENIADLVPDPLGAADEIFFQACLGMAAPLVSGRDAGAAVALAERLTALAEASAA